MGNIKGKYRKISLNLFLMAYSSAGCLSCLQVKCLSGKWLKLTSTNTSDVKGTVCSCYCQISALLMAQLRIAFTKNSFPSLTILIKKCYNEIICSKNVPSSLAAMGQYLSKLSWFCYILFELPKLLLKILCSLIILSQNTPN